MIHFCSTSFDDFWATFPNISHLDPKPRYNSWKVLMIRVMHVIPVVENEKICKPMVDHFQWNEFEETHTLQTCESRVSISVRVYVFSLLHLQVKMLTNCKLFKNACPWYVVSFEEVGCSLLMLVQPWCF